MDWLLPDPALMSGPVFLFAILVTILAAFVKGAVGFAMPLIMVSGLASVLSPEIAVAMLIVPTVLSNIIQAFRDGIAAAVAVCKTYAVYITVLLIGIAISAQLVVVLPTNVLFLLLGIAITVFSLLQLIGIRLELSRRGRRWAEIVIGSIAGLIGGVSGSWGPPTVLYLNAIDAPKAEAMRVQGVLYGAGSVMLLLAHLKSGVLNAETFRLSWMMVPPAALGMAIGMWVQGRLNQQGFRKATQVVLVLAGLNLIRRGLLG